MATYKLLPSTLKRAIGTVSLRNDNKQLLKVETVVLSRIQAVGQKQFNHAIGDILLIYSEVNRLPSPNHQKITAEKFNGGTELLPVTFPDYSEEYKKDLEGKHNVDTNKPFYNLTDDLSKWMLSKKVLTGQTRVQNVVHQSLGTRELKFSGNRQTLLAKGENIPLLNVKAKMRFPTFADSLMRTVIMENYFNGFNGVQTLNALEKPATTDSQRNSMKIYGNEKRRPLIGTLANWHGKQAIAEIRNRLAGTLQGAKIKPKRR